VLASTLLPTGCVRRRLAVRSNPPGALVFVDNQQIGTTPCSVDFTYYGTREIRLVKPGYETLTVNQPIPTPWYEIPPIDFVSENLMPNKIMDHRTASFEMQPQLIVPTEQLLDRANELRQATLEEATVPAASVAIPNAMSPLSPMPLSPVPLSPVPAGPPPGTAPIGSPFDTPQPMPLPPTTLPPTTLSPTPLPPTSSVAPPSTFSPTPAFAPSTAAPFAPPTLPSYPPTAPMPNTPQQGPPIVSPPLR
jgi:hypothetical protein